MFCENCGNKLPDDALFCDACGHKVSMPNEPSGQQPAQQQYQPVNQSAMQGGQIPQKPVERKPMSSVTKILIAEAALFVVLAGVFLLKMKEYTSPETAAKQYFTAVMAGEQKKAYDMIEVEESEFVNEKCFGNVLKQIGCKNVNNFKVKTSESKSDDYAKEVNITYRIKEDTQDYSFSVKLEKANKKRFFFFDDWKVNVGDYIQKNLELSVIKDSEIIFEGVKLGEKYLSDSQDEAGRDKYVIPKMFYGTYQVVVTNDVYTDWHMTVTADGEESTFYEDYDSVSIKQEILQKVLKQSEADFKTLWDSAAKKLDFTQLSGIQIAQDTTAIEENYATLVEKFTQEDGTGIKKMNFENIEVTALDSGGDMEFSDLSINVEFNTSFTCTSAQKDWWTGRLEESEDSGDYSGRLCYAYENGEWVLADGSLSLFYY